MVRLCSPRWKKFMRTRHKSIRSARHSPEDVHQSEGQSQPLVVDWSECAQASL